MLEEMVSAYIECALWSSYDVSEEDPGDPLDAFYTADDVAPSALAEIRRDCAAFLDTAVIASGDRVSADMLGHDFWLTRNGHGAGFWDRGLGKLGDVLTDWAHSFGTSDMYVGDDGLVYVS